MSEITGGKIKKRLVEETEIEWEIVDFLSFIDTFCVYKSPVFYFANDSWYMKLYKNCGLDSECMSLYLNCDVERTYSVEYSFGVKKQDGSVEYLIRNIMPGHKIWSKDFWRFIKHSDVLKRKADIVPFGNFTIICRLQSLITPSADPIVLDKLEMLKRLDKLSINFKDLFADQETCDVILKVQDEEYKAHRTVLMARSRVFAATFKHDTLERQTGVITITDCDSDSFQKFLEYLYSGELKELCFRSAITLYYTSDKYDVEELKDFCVDYLMQHLTAENVCDIAAFADQHDENKLFSEAQSFFNENVKKIFVTPEWESFLKNNLRLANKLLVEMSKEKH